MKKLTALILVIIIAIMPITVHAADNSDVPVGDTLSPTISADSLEDFTKKLSELTVDDIEICYIGTISFDDIYTKVLLAIDSGENYLYLPSIDCEITNIRLFVMSDHSFVPAASTKYGMFVAPYSKIALYTHCSFRYDNTDCRIGYGAPVLANKIITLRDKIVPYSSNGNSTSLYFEYGGTDFELYIGQSLTEEEIKALPEGLFTPKIIALNTLTASANEDDSTISVVDPKEAISLCEED